MGAEYSIPGSPNGRARTRGRGSPSPEGSPLRKRDSPLVALAQELQAATTSATKEGIVVALLNQVLLEGHVEGIQQYMQLHPVLVELVCVTAASSSKYQLHVDLVEVMNILLNSHNTEESGKILEMCTQYGLCEWLVAYITLLHTRPPTEARERGGDAHDTLKVSKQKLGPKESHYFGLFVLMRQCMSRPSFCKEFCNEKGDRVLAQILHACNEQSWEAVPILGLLLLVSQGNSTKAILPMTQQTWKILTLLLRSLAIERIGAAATYIWGALQDKRKREDVRRLMISHKYHDVVATAVDTCTRAIRNHDNTETDIADGSFLERLPLADLISTLHCMLPEALTQSLAFASSGCGSVWAFLFAFCEVRGQFITQPWHPNTEAVTVAEDQRKLRQRDKAPGMNAADHQVVDLTLTFTEAITKTSTRHEALVAPGVFTMLLGLCRLLPQWVSEDADLEDTTQPQDESADLCMQLVKRVVEQQILLSFEAPRMKLAFLMDPQLPSLLFDCHRWLQTRLWVLRQLMRVVNHCIEVDIGRGQQANREFTDMVQGLFLNLAMLLMALVPLLARGPPTLASSDALQLSPDIQYGPLAHMLVGMLMRLLGRHVRVVPPPLQRSALAKQKLSQLATAFENNSNALDEVLALHSHIWASTIEQEEAIILNGVVKLQRTFRALHQQTGQHQDVEDEPLARDPASYAGAMPSTSTPSSRRTSAASHATAESRPTTATSHATGASRPMTATSHATNPDDESAMSLEPPTLQPPVEAVMERRTPRHSPVSAERPTATFAERRSLSASSGKATHPPVAPRAPSPKPAPHRRDATSPTTPPPAHARAPTKAQPTLQGDELSLVVALDVAKEVDRAHTGPTHP